MNLHVVKRPRGWAVKEESGDQISRTYREKNKALRWAKNQGTSVVVHNTDGKFTGQLKGKPKNKGPNQHVIPNGENWAVKCERCIKNTEIFDDRTEAVVRAEQIASNYKSQVVVHRSDGTIEDFRSPRYIKEEPQGMFWSIFGKN